MLSYTSGLHAFSHIPPKITLINDATPSLEDGSLKLIYLIAPLLPPGFFTAPGNVP